MKPNSVNVLINTDGLIIHHCHTAEGYLNTSIEIAFALNKRRIFFKCKIENGTLPNIIFK